MIRTSRNIFAGVRRGISILEVLVSLAIVLTLMAVVLPWTFEWLGGRELDNAEDSLAMHMMMARAAAREEGRPIEVIAQFGSLDGSSDGGVGGSVDGRFGGSVEARWMNLDDATTPLDVLDGAVFGAVSPGASDPDSIQADWARFELPSGIRIAMKPAPDASDADEDATDVGRNDSRNDGTSKAAHALGSDEFDAPQQSQTLAIFLPDGTVIVAPIFMLQTNAGVARAMRVDRVTGRPRSVATETVGEKFPTVRPDFDPAD